jgi:hypothetical protein
MVGQPGADGVAGGVVVGQQALVAHRRGDADERPAVVAGERRAHPAAVGQDQDARALDLQEEQVLRPHPGQGRVSGAASMAARSG